MSSMHLLYLESILGITIGAFSSNVAEFSGELSLEVINKLVATSGAMFWQNPECPVIDKAYLKVPVAGEEIVFAIDYNFNMIQVA